MNGFRLLQLREEDVQRGFVLSAQPVGHLINRCVDQDLRIFLS